MVKQQSRIVWVDITRVLAIYLVMLVHSVVFPENVTAETRLTLFILFAIAKTSVPVFVMLSGAFLLNKHEPYRVFFKKRLLRLLIPWITWTVVFVFWHTYTEQTSIQTVGELFRLIRQLFLSFWFLPMVFVLYLLTPAIRIFYQHAAVRDILLVVALWFIGVSFLPYVHNTEAFPLSSDNGLVRQAIQFGGYFLLGGLLIKTSFTRMRVVAIALFVTGIIWTVFSTIQTSLHNKTLFVGVHFDYVAPGIVFASVGLFLFIMSFKDLLQKQFSQKTLHYLTYLSKATLGMYLVHHLFIPMAQQLFPRQHGANTIDVGMILLMSVFLFFTSAVTLAGLQRIPVINRYVT